MTFPGDTVLRHLAILLAVGVGACSSGEHIGTAEQAVADFRRQMAAQQFSHVYAKSSEEFRKSASEADITKFFAAVQKKLGNVKSAEKNGWHLNYQPSGTFVTLGFRTEFEKGAGTEQFVFRVVNGHASLVGYNVNSPLLITN
jgi:hypothetical protein